VGILQKYFEKMYLSPTASVIKSASPVQEPLNRWSCFENDFDS
jgi:hypothetical protein